MRVMKEWGSYLQGELPYLSELLGQADGSCATTLHCGTA